MKVLLEEKSLVFVFLVCFCFVLGGDKIGKMIKVILEAQGQVVLGNLKILGNSESPGDPAYLDEPGSWE